MRIVKSLFFIFLLSQLPIASVWSIDLDKNNSEVHFVFEFNNNSLTLNASNVPLNIIFKHFCKKTFVCPVVEGELTEKVSFLFNKLSIEQALRRIAKGKSFIITYTSSPKGLIPDKRVIKEFRVFGEYFEADNFNTISLEERKKLRKIDEIDMLGDIDATAELSKMLLSEKSTLIKITLIEKLSQREGEQLVDTLAYLLGDQDSDVRAVVIDSLGNLKSTQSSLLLAQVMFGDPSPELRKVVLEKLSTFPILPAKYFIQAAKKDSNKSVQQEVDYALEAWKFAVPELK